MGEGWHCIYLQVDDEAEVVFGIRHLIGSKGHQYSPEWSSFLPLRWPLLPPGLSCWISPSIRGWVSVSEHFPALLLRPRELSRHLRCLTFQCWIGEGHWGYSLYDAASLVDRFDSDPHQAIHYDYDFLSDQWERRSPYAALRSGKLNREKIRELFGGHPERLDCLPLREETTPGQLRRIMDSRGISQSDIVHRFAEHIDIPNFLPGVLMPEGLDRAALHRFDPEQPEDPYVEFVVRSIEKVGFFMPEAFRPLTVNQYQRWARRLPRRVAWAWVWHAIDCWERWYLRAFSPGPEERSTVEEEVRALQALIKKL